VTSRTRLLHTPGAWRRFRERRARRRVEREEKFELFLRDHLAHEHGYDSWDAMLEAERKRFSTP
jgi:hypothetical protein